MFLHKPCFYYYTVGGGAAADEAARALKSTSAGQQNAFWGVAAGSDPFHHWWCIRLEHSTRSELDRDCPWGVVWKIWPPRTKRLQAVNSETTARARVSFARAGSF